MSNAKLGASHYNWPGYDLEGFMRRAAQIGYRFVELSCRDLWDPDTDPHTRINPKRPRAARGDRE